MQRCLIRGTTNQAQWQQPTFIKNLIWNCIILHHCHQVGTMQSKYSLCFTLMGYNDAVEGLLLIVLEGRGVLIWDCRQKIHLHFKTEPSNPVYRSHLAFRAYPIYHRRQRTPSSGHQSGLVQTVKPFPPMCYIHQLWAANLTPTNCMCLDCGRKLENLEHPHKLHRKTTASKCFLTRDLLAVRQQCVCDLCKKCKTESKNLDWIDSKK